jgi:hypothetical protein
LTAQPEKTGCAGQQGYKSTKPMAHGATEADAMSVLCTPIVAVYL